MEKYLDIAIRKYMNLTEDELKYYYIVNNEIHVCFSEDLFFGTIKMEDILPIIRNIKIKNFISLHRYRDSNDMYIKYVDESNDELYNIKTIDEDYKTLLRMSKLKKLYGKITNR